MFVYRSAISLLRVRATTQALINIELERITYRWRNVQTAELEVHLSFPHPPQIAHASSLEAIFKYIIQTWVIDQK